MSLQPQPIGPIPEDTVTVAQAAFPKGNLYMQMRDALGTLYEDHDFAALFPPRGQPALAPWRLALTTVMQFVEGLSDRQAAEAVRARIDWKYALGLTLTDAGFDFSVLSEFRSRLLAGSAEQVLLDRMLERLRAKGHLKARGRQRTDSTHVLAAVRTLNRLESVGETMRAALNTLATVAPAWLRAHAQPEWVERYGHRVEEYWLPKGAVARREYGVVIGQDGLTLLRAIDAETAPAWLREVPAVVTLRQMWDHQYIQEGEQLRLRAAGELVPAGERFDSPYDPEAHFGNKGSTTWLGYRVHVTETCDPDEPHLITHVATTNAVVPDVAMTATIQADLAARELLPEQHIVDGGYIDAEIVPQSLEQHGVTMIGPMRHNGSWQEKAGQGYDISQFKINWKAKRVRCPQGRVAKSWSPSTDACGNPTIVVKFSRTDCGNCAVRSLCTRAKGSARTLTLRPQVQHEAIQSTRQQQTTSEWKAQYDVRAGIEGTLSQGIRAFQLRQTRYIGEAKARLQHVVTAVAMNVVRIVAWLQGTPQEKTRVSRFTALMATG